MKIFFKTNQPTSLLGCRLLHHAVQHTLADFLAGSYLRLQELVLSVDTCCIDMLLYVEEQQQQCEWSVFCLFLVNQTLENKAVSVLALFTLLGEESAHAALLVTAHHLLSKIITVSKVKWSRQLVHPLGSLLPLSLELTCCRYGLRLAHTQAVSTSMPTGMALPLWVCPYLWAPCKAQARLLAYKICCMLWTQGRPCDRLHPACGCGWAGRLNTCRPGDK